MLLSPEHSCWFPPGRVRSVAFWLVAVMSLGLGAAGLAQQRSVPGNEWETLQNCELVPGSTLDGDSFHLRHKGRDYIFRLYFVDAPETSDAVPERLVDQAAYFGIATNAVTKAGELAAEFTRQQLTGSRITVITRWQNGMGRSSLARFYAVVLVGGKNLSAELVGAGLARIYGYRANWPDGPRSTTFSNHLKNLELGAREKRLGIWNEHEFARVGSEPVARPGAPEPADRSRPTATLIDLNLATAAELDRLPGVGKVIAARIIAHRPYRTVEELRKVPGIGVKTLERLRPLVRVTESRD